MGTTILLTLTYLLLRISGGLTVFTDSSNSQIVPDEIRCTLLILQNRIAHAAQLCDNFPYDQLKKVVQDSYASWLPNADRVIDFLSISSTNQQLHGYGHLLELLHKDNATSTRQSLRIASNLRELEYWFGENDSIRRLLNSVKASVSKEIRQLFWHDWCVISNEKRLYEYLYVDDVKSSFGTVYTYTEGDGITYDIGHWKLEPIVKEGIVRFKIKNRARGSQYLGQKTSAEGQIDCEQRRVISGIDGEIGFATIWELEPHLHTCLNCFKIKSTEFPSSSDYIFTYPYDLEDRYHRKSRTGFSAVIDPREDLWEIRCWEGNGSLVITRTK